MQNSQGRVRGQDLDLITEDLLGAEVVLSGEQGSQIDSRNQKIYTKKSSISTSPANMEKKEAINNIQIETNLPYNKAKRKKMLTDA